MYEMLTSSCLLDRISRWQLSYKPTERTCLFDGIELGTLILRERDGDRLHAVEHEQFQDVAHAFVIQQGEMRADEEKARAVDRRLQGEVRRADQQFARRAGGT